MSTAAGAWVPGRSSVSIALARAGSRIARSQLASRPDLAAETISSAFWHDATAKVRNSDMVSMVTPPATVSTARLLYARNGTGGFGDGVAEGVGVATDVA